MYTKDQNIQFGAIFKQNKEKCTSNHKYFKNINPTTSKCLLLETN